MSETQKHTKPNVPNLSVKREQKELQIHSAERETNVGRNVPNLRFPGFEGEWKECRNEDLGKVITGNTPPTAETRYYENGYKLWASPADLSGDKYISRTQTRLTEEGFSKTRVVPQGTTLVTCIGSTIGKMGMASQEMSTNQQINSVIPYESTDGQYLYYAIQSQFPRYVNSIAVQAVPIISKGTFEKLKNYRPNIDEQRRIGSFLDLLDRRITIQNKVIEDLKKLKTAIEERIIKLVQGKQISLGDILEERNEKSTENNQFEVLSSTVTGIFNQREYFNKDIASANNAGYKIVRRGDIVLSPQNLWMGNINYNDCFEIGIVSPSYKVFSIRKAFDERYVSFLLKTKKALWEYSLVSEQGASIVRRNLNLESFLEISFPIPSYIKQKEIGDMISAVNSKLLLEQKLLNSLSRQKSYLLNSMFI